MVFDNLSVFCICVAHSNLGGLQHDANALRACVGAYSHRFLVSNNKSQSRCDQPQLSSIDSHTRRQGSGASLLSRSSSASGSPPRRANPYAEPFPSISPWREAAVPTRPPPLSAPWPASRARAPNLASSPLMYAAAASAPAAVAPFRGGRRGAEAVPGGRAGSWFAPLAEQGGAGAQGAPHNFHM